MQRQKGSEGTESAAGLALAISAYLLWGLAPIYMKTLAHVPALEFVAHRVIWAVPVAGAVLVVMRRTSDLVAALKSPRMLLMAAMTAAAVSVNWGVFVWAISNDQALDAALGYYINPLFSVALGALVLREKLTWMELVAVALAACGVLALLAESGTVPWVALTLTLSWGIYALLKRTLPIGPNQGFLLELLVLLPVALAYIGWRAATGVSSFGGSTSDTILLIGLGPVTAVPLLIYANAAKMVRLSTIGILQYIAPTMMFLTAILLFGEEIDRGRMIAFPMIWAALVVYSLSKVREMRRARVRG